MRGDEMPPKNSFKAENQAFVAWLRRQCDVVEADLAIKHEHMRRDPFVFLRATYFRWARRIEAVCPELSRAPAVLAVGDAHLENFGTWRDAEARLVWGINDFDEAAVMPYPLDLVRLVTSAHLAPGLKMPLGEIARCVLHGYKAALAAPRPTLLDDHEKWMRPHVACSDVERAKFWDVIDRLPQATPPRSVARELQRSLPDGAEIRRFATRMKGMGGRGRVRYVADARWSGGRVLREARAVVPSGWHWAHHDKDAPLRCIELAGGAHRAPDPTLDLIGQFVFRRISADARKVELDRAAQARLTDPLLEAMGFDLGAIHAAAKKNRVTAIRADLKARPAGWLQRAAAAASADVLLDYKEWTG
jgi:hypothetical protein